MTQFEIPSSPESRLGQLAVNAGYIARSQLEGLLQEQQVGQGDAQQMWGQSIGQLLVSRGLLTETQLEVLVAEQTRIRDAALRREATAKVPIVVAPGTLWVDRYVLERRLTDDTDRHVFVARDTEEDRQVVLKVVPTGQDADTIWNEERMRREIYALGKLDHPNIVKLLDSGTAAFGDRTVRYFTMEYIDGPTLDEACQSARPSPRWALETVCRLAEAVHYVHERGFVHRDLKPTNVVLASRDRPVLLDFGLAWLSQPQDLQLRRTAPGLWLGTPEFMAPEQLDSGAPLDRRADVYGLGGLLLWMLTGLPPNRIAAGAGVYELAQAMGQPPPDHGAYPHLDAGLADLWAATLATDQDDRTPSAAAVAEAIKEYLASHDQGKTHRLLRLRGGLVTAIELTGVPLRVKGERNPFGLPDDWPVSAFQLLMPAGKCLFLGDPKVPCAEGLYTRPRGPVRHLDAIDVLGERFVYRSEPTGDQLAQSHGATTDSKAPVLQALCGSCRGKLRIPLQKAGWITRCPLCSTMILIPTADEVDAAKPVRFTCRVMDTARSEAPDRGSDVSADDSVEVPALNPAKAPAAPSDKEYELRGGNHVAILDTTRGLERLAKLVASLPADEKQPITIDLTAIKSLELSALAPVILALLSARASGRPAQLEATTRQRETLNGAALVDVVRLFGDS